MVALASFPAVWAAGVPHKLRPLSLYAPLAVFYARMPAQTAESGIQGRSSSHSRLATLSPRLSSPLLAPETAVEEAPTARSQLLTLRLGLEVACWHLPQRLAAASLQRLAGIRMHEPQATVVDARLAVGPTPLSASDVSDLATKYRVGSVLEIRPPLFPAILVTAYVVGPDVRVALDARERIGLSPDDLRAAAAFIRGRIDAEPHKRTFVACPDGATFAPVVAAAYLCSTQRLDHDQAADALERHLPHAALVRGDPALRMVADKLRDERELDGWSVIDKGDLLADSV